MKTRLLGHLSILSTLLLMAATAHAEEVLVVAKIPFAFEVGNVTLPAGEYTVGRLGPPGVAYAIRSADGVHSIFFSALAAEPKTGTDKEWTLVFDRLGDKSFLRDVWIGSGERGLTLPKSKDERELLALGREVQSRIEIADAGH